MSGPCMLHGRIECADCFHLDLTNRFDEYEEFVGGESDEEPGALCRRCNDYPCSCGHENEGSL